MGASSYAGTRREPETELGWTLAREHWGNGYATEAARAARDWAYEERGVDRLISLIAPRQRALDPRRGEARRGAGGDDLTFTGRPTGVGASAMSFVPLAGIRVVDVTSSLAGPSCTQLLASLGADVVKIEPLGGDHARAWGPPFVDGEGAMFLASNAGKRSLALDLSDPRGLEALLRLADRSDVLVQSLRPGAAERARLRRGRRCARRNPRLVYCSIGAFGSKGPLRDQPGYDPLLQAASGIMSVTGVDEMPPVRVGVSLIDFGTGVWAALGVVAALHERGARARDARSRCRCTRRRCRCSRTSSSATSAPARSRAARAARSRRSRRTRSSRRATAS